MLSGEGNAFRTPSSISPHVLATGRCSLSMRAARRLARDRAIPPMASPPDFRRPLLTYPSLHPARFARGISVTPHAYSPRAPLSSAPLSSRPACAATATLSGVPLTSSASDKTGLT